MKKALLIITSLLILGGITGCGMKSNLKSGYEKISAKEAKEIIDNSKDEIILDVRTKEEYSQGHIKGAILIPNETIKDVKLSKLKDLNATILVYCRSGNRSADASAKLAKIGYTNVKDFGGINSWPYDIEK